MMKRSLKKSGRCVSAVVVLEESCEVGRSVVGEKLLHL
jgi:hypothetical protein